MQKLEQKFFVNKCNTKHVFFGDILSQMIKKVTNDFPVLN